jgi:hypothetical protein
MDAQLCGPIPNYYIAYKIMFDNAAKLSHPPKP